MTWPLVRLDEVARVVGGATPSSKIADYWGGDVLWVTPADLSKLDGRYISDTPRKITEAGLHSCAAEVLPAESVLLSSRAPIGQVAINSKPMATNQGFKSLVPDRQRLDPIFLYWWLRSNRQKIERLGNGATFKEVSKAVVSRVEIPLPPLDEQRRISAILDEADALRALRKTAIKSAEQILTSYFIVRFGNPLAPEYTKSKTVRLGDCTRIRTGKLDANAAVSGGRYPFFTCAVEPLWIDTPAFDGKAVLVAGNGDLNVKYYEGKFNAYQRTYVIQSSDDKVLSARFISSFLTLYLQKLRSQSIGGVIKYIRLPHLTEAPIYVPSMEEQSEFDKFALDVERLTNYQRNSLLRLDELSAALYQRMLSNGAPSKKARRASPNPI